MSTVRISVDLCDGNGYEFFRDTPENLGMRPTADALNALEAFDKGVASVRASLVSFVERSSLATKPTSPRG